MIRETMLTNLTVFIDDLGVPHLRPSKYVFRHPSLREHEFTWLEHRDAPLQYGQYAELLSMWKEIFSSHRIDIAQFAFHHDKLQQLPSFLSLFVFIYLIGLVGIFSNFKNFLVAMLSVEVMYAAIVTLFALVSFGFGYHNEAGVWSLLIIVVAACESAIGLGLLIVLYRYFASVNFSSYTGLNTSVQHIARAIFCAKFFTFAK